MYTHVSRCIYAYQATCLERGYQCLGVKIQVRDLYRHTWRGQRKEKWRQSWYTQSAGKQIRRDHARVRLVRKRGRKKERKGARRRERKEKGWKRASKW